MKVVGIKEEREAKLEMMKQRRKGRRARELEKKKEMEKLKRK